MRLLLSAVLACCAASASLGAPTNLLEDARREVDAGRLGAALALLNQAPPAEASAPILTLRGILYLDQGKYDEAAADFTAASAKDPISYPPRLYLGQALLQQKKWGEARALFEEMETKTNILILNERLRYAILLTYLGAKDDAGAKAALDRLVFPTESPAYYYAQAAWGFAHDNSKAALKWLKTAEGIFDDKRVAWFARPLYDFGWIKKKPAISTD
ncbi:MAG: tetratricopeptide repeat protein [Chthoniobacterales bacterium]